MDFLNDEFVTKENAKISVYDHGFLYGDGVFEGIRVYSGNVFRMKEHIDRLYNSAKSILLNIPYTKEELTNIIVQTVQKTALKTLIFAWSCRAVSVTLDLIHTNVRSHK